jgi:hypothetical protein
MKCLKIASLLVAAALLFAVPTTLCAKGPKFSFSVNIDALQRPYHPPTIALPHQPPTIIEHHYIPYVPYYQQHTIIKEYYPSYPPYYPYPR